MPKRVFITVDNDDQTSVPVDQEDHQTSASKKQKKQKTKQPNLFSIPNFDVTQTLYQNRKRQKVISSFIRKEKVAIGGSTGVFKATCKFCFQEFKNAQGLGNHLNHCPSNTKTTNKSEGLNFLNKEILVSKHTTNDSSTCSSITIQSSITSSDKRKHNKGSVE